MLREGKVQSVEGRDYGGQKCLGWLDNVRKQYRPLSALYRTKLARDRFATGDTFQKLGMNRFLH
jgi:hypothetical protein